MIEQGGTKKLSLQSGTEIIGSVYITDGVDTADVIDQGTYAGIGAVILDGSGNPISSFGGGTQYTEDAAAAANPVGTAVNLIRQDTPAGLVSNDGDNVAQRGTNYGAAFVQIVNSSGSFVDSFGGGVQYTEGDTDASVTGTAVMWEDTGDTMRVASAAKPLPITAVGAAAQGAAVSGNPVLIGAEDPDGNVIRLQTAADGDLVVHQHSASTALADAVSNTMHIPVNQTDAGFLATPTAGYMYNGTSWDRVRGDSTNGLTVNLGSNNDVTVTSSALPSGAATSAKQDTIIGHIDGLETTANSIKTNTDYGIVTGGGVELGALRVTIANDSTGVLSVDDNGGSLTIDGTVAATQSGTWTEANSAAIAASLSVLDDWDESDRAKVNPIVGQAGVQGGSGTVSNNTQRVVLATDVALPAGTAIIGGTIPTASASGTGLSVSKTDAQTATVTAVKAGSGRVYGYHIYNPNTSDAYFHFYNIASGSVTVGTSTRTRTLWIPAGGAIDTVFTVPLTFDTAISTAATTTITGSSAPSTGLLADIDYI